MLRVVFYQQSETESPVVASRRSQGRLHGGEIGEKMQ
jgi:hypothetical protein